MLGWFRFMNHELRKNSSNQFNRILKIWNQANRSNPNPLSISLSWSGSYVVCTPLPQYISAKVRMSYGLLWLKQFVLSITSVILVFIFYRRIHYSYGGSIWYATHCAKINYDGNCNLLKNKFGQVNFKR